MTAAEAFAREVVSGKEPANKLVISTCERFLSDLKRKDVYFDEQTANRFVDFAEHFLCLWEDQWRGKPLKLVPWQKFIIQNLFAWKYKDTGLRRYRSAYIQTPRKQAKTTLVAVISWLHMIVDDSTDTPSILVGANNEKQAKICSNSVAQMVFVSPQLNEYHNEGKIKMGFYNEYYHRVSYKPNSDRQAILEAISRDPRTKDGFNPSLGIIDEYHEAKDDKLLKVMQTGQVTRGEPLLIVITTAGFNKAYPCYRILRKSAIDILSKKIEFDSRFVMVYEPDDGDDWNDPKTWEKVNPMIRHVPSIRKSLEELYHVAKTEGGTAEVEFRTKNLSEWVDAPTVWIPTDILLQNDHGITEDELIGRECYGGLDAAKSLDLNAFALFFPNVRENVHAVKMLYWIAQDKLNESDDVADYWRWVKDGHFITQPSNVIEFNLLAEDIVRECKKYNLKGIGYDRHYAYQVLTQVVRLGYPEDIGYPVAQGFGSSQHVVTLEKYLYKKEMDLMKNPVLMWNFSNTSMHKGFRGDKYPIKLDERQKIDGVTAIVDAIAEYKRQNSDIPQKVRFAVLG